MIIGIIYAIVISFLAILFSPLFKGIYKDSGLGRRLISYLVFLPVYVVFVFILIEYDLGTKGTKFWYGLSLFNGVILYSVIFFVYESLLSKVERSVTIKIFLEVYKRKHVECYENSLEDIVDKEEMLLTRIDGLLREKFIQGHKGCYRATDKGKRCAKIIIFIRNLFWAS